MLCLSLVFNVLHPSQQGSEFKICVPIHVKRTIDRSSDRTHLASGARTRSAQDGDDQPTMQLCDGRYFTGASRDFESSTILVVLIIGSLDGADLPGGTVLRPCSFSLLGGPAIRVHKDFEQSLL